MAYKHGRPYHPLRRARVRLLTAERDVRVVDDQGELIGRCTIDPARGYQPLQKALVSAMS